jgi:hypothetical protein
MPLPAEVQTLPLRLAEVCTSADPAADWRPWLATARLGTLPFLWLLLWASYRLAAWYGGVSAGRLAVALTACEPILLGHASLTATDLAFTACVVMLMAVFCTRRDEPTWLGRLGWPAFWVMMTFMTKASALMFVPVTLTMVELHRLWNSGWRPGRSLEVWKPALRSLRDLTAVGLMGVALLMVVCPRAPRGLLFQLRHNLDDRAISYLFESVSPTGFWYYFPAALAIKIGLPILLLLAVTLMRPRYWLNGPMCAALMLLALTPNFRVQLGVRYVLPVAALAIIAGSATLGRWWSELDSNWKRLLAGGFASGLVLWSLTSAVLVWPNGICYTNELFGGTSRAYLALHESNLDWGQGLPELADWQRQHDDAPLYLWYFGSDPAALQSPFHAISPGTDISEADLERLCQGGYLAASTSLEYGYFFDTPISRHLRARQPIARTTTYLIYDFRQSGPTP